MANWAGYDESEIQSFVVFKIGDVVTFKNHWTLDKYERLRIKIGSFSKVLPNAKTIKWDTSADAQKLYAQTKNTNSIKGVVLLGENQEGYWNEWKVMYGLTVNVDLNRARPKNNGFTFRDTNPKSIAITGNNQHLIQGLSTLEISVNGASSPSQANIVKYVVSQSTQQRTITKAPAKVTMPVDNVGNISSTVYDSRNMQTSISKQPVITPFKFMTLNNLSFDRRNKTEETVFLNLNGKIDLLFLNGKNNNRLKVMRYRYKLNNVESAQWSAWISVLHYSEIDEKGSFNINRLNIGNTFSTEQNYDFEFNVEDELFNITEKYLLTKSSPTFSLRDKIVAVNKQADTSRVGLDVKGDIWLNDVKLGVGGAMVEFNVAVFQGNTRISVPDPYKIDDFREIIVNNQYGHDVVVSNRSKPRVFEDGKILLSGTTQNIISIKMTRVSEKILQVTDFFFIPHKANGNHGAAGNYTATKAYGELR